MDCHDEDYFSLSYEGTNISIHKEIERKYVFSASFSLDASKMSKSGKPIECTRETLEKAVALTKQKNFECIKDQISFDPCWQEWRIGLEYPYFQLEYSLSGETYSLRTDDELSFANISVYSPAFPAVMTLIHELAVLYQSAQRVASSKKTEPLEKDKPLYKVICPFCKKSTRHNSIYCSVCGKPLLDVHDYIFTEEEVDLDETIHLCRFCGNDVSWEDYFCRNCGKRLRE